MSFDFKKLITFQVNVGTKEKKIRLYAGAALLFISLFLGSIIMLIIGVVLVATGYTRFCPAYAAMDRNTCEADE